MSFRKVHVHVEQQLSCLGADSVSAHPAEEGVLPVDKLEGHPDYRVLLGIPPQAPRLGSGGPTAF